MSKIMGLMKNWPASGNCDQALTKVPQSCCIRRHHSSTGHMRLCRTSATVGVVRAPSPGAWEEGETLLMSLLEDCSPVSVTSVRWCQGMSYPRACKSWSSRVGPLHYITYTTIVLLSLILPKAIQNCFNLLKAITEWFGMEGSFRGHLGWTSLQWASSTWWGCSKDLPSPTLNVV